MGKTPSVHGSAVDDQKGRESFLRVYMIGALNL